MAGTALYFDIFGRDKGVGDMLDGVGTKAQATDVKIRGISGGLSTLAKGIALKEIGEAVGGAMVNLAQLAATAEQNTGAVEKVFGSAASKVEEFADRSAKAVGLSESQYNNLSATVGTALKAAGVPFDQLAEKNDALIKRGSDMAAVFGGTTKEAVEAMGSAFRGEFDPLERFGVTLTMNQVNAELAARGQDKLSGAALEAAKKTAIYDLIMKQSNDSAGQFADEQDSAAGATQIAQASFENASVTLGEKLLPAMTWLAEAATNVAGWLEKNADFVTNLAIVLGVLAAGLGVAAAAQWVMNIAMAANPIGALILAVTALIAVIVLLAANWENITRFLTEAWNNFTRWWGDGMNKMGNQWNQFWGDVGRNARAVWDQTLGPVFETIRDVVVNKIPAGFRTGVDAITRAWEGVKQAAKAPVNFVINDVWNHGLLAAFNKVADFFKIGRIPEFHPPGFESGGYTGNMPKSAVAGVVHGGEYVFTAEETQKAGVGTFRRLSRMLRGFADGGFVNPVAGGGTITQGFSGLNGHNGIDIAAPMNTPILAAFDGNVTWTGWSQYGGGNEIHIQHAGGWETWYAHLNRILVKAGQVVNRAATIGLMGSTGRSTGSHLHYMLMKGGWPNVVDPSGAMQGKVPAGFVFDPIGPIINGLVGSFNNLFSGPAADLAIGAGKKLMGDVGGWVMRQLGLGTYDNGGWLMPGGLGMNQGNRPEAVLTPDESAGLKALVGGRGLKLDLTGYALELNADATKAMFVRTAQAAADMAVHDADDDIYRGRAR